MKESDLTRYNRQGSLGNEYWTICGDSYADYVRARLQRSNQTCEPEYSAAGRQADQAGLKVIVFAAMCLEAAIFDYAAIHLGDKYVLQNLDRLDLAAKWAVVPRLITGKSLRPDGQALADLNGLIRARNKLVHAKSAPLNWEQWRQPGYPEASAMRFHANVVTAIRACLLVAAELSTMHRWPRPLWWIHLDEEMIFEEGWRCPEFQHLRALARKYHRDCNTADHSDGSEQANRNGNGTE
jgi:hypothetical protein